MWPTNLSAPGRPGASCWKRTLEAPRGRSARRQPGPLACRGRAEPAGRSPLLLITERWTKPAGPPCPSFCPLMQPREGLCTPSIRPPHGGRVGKSRLWENRLFACVSPLPGPVGRRPT